MAASIVAAIDRSPAALQAARLLAGYRGDRAALSVVLVNVQPAGTRDADLRRDGAAELEPARELLAAAGLAVETRVHLGEPSTRVIEEAAQRKAAAIVAGTRGRGVLGGFALGSVSLPLAQAARAPVLLVQEQSRLPGGLGRALRALVALDGSPQAMRALSALLDLESWLGALDLDLAYVRAASPSDELDRLQAEEATRDARALLYLARRSYRVHEPAGDPALELARLASALGAELVVTGTRGRGALHHALLGSVALKTALASPVPVMLVP